MARNRVKRENKCTWFRAIAFLIICIIAGILTWLLTPWDDIIGSILPTFENTKTGDDGGIIGNGPTFPISLTPTSSPTKVSSQFNRCNPNSEAPCCNGLESNCQLKVNEIMYASSHNAMSSEEDGFSGYNHFLSLEKSLEKGYRALLLDLCDCGNDGLQLCHSICAAGKRDPVAALQNIYDFLLRNPEEVLILVFQFGKDVLGQRPIQVKVLEDTIRNIPGMLDILYKHDSDSNEWPTLQEAIQSGQRIILFHHETSPCEQDGCPDGFLPYFQYAVETPFFFQNIGDLRDHKSSCLLSRGHGGTRDFYNVNNFVTKLLPDEEIARIINEKSFVTEHVQECNSIIGKTPNLVTVDFWHEGDLLEVVQEMNSMIG